MRTLLQLSDTFPGCLLIRFVLLHLHIQISSNLFQKRSKKIKKDGKKSNSMVFEGLQRSQPTGSRSPHPVAQPSQLQRFGERCLPKRAECLTSPSLHLVGQSFWPPPRISLTISNQNIIHYKRLARFASKQLYNAISFRHANSC